jgi:hypothetical protein
MLYWCKNCCSPRPFKPRTDPAGIQREWGQQKRLLLCVSDRGVWFHDLHLQGAIPGLGRGDESKNGQEDVGMFGLQYLYAYYIVIFLESKPRCGVFVGITELNPWWFCRLQPMIFHFWNDHALLHGRGRYHGILPNQQEKKRDLVLGRRCFGSQVYMNLL